MLTEPEKSRPVPTAGAAAIEDPALRVHFVGVAGTGMSALAQWRAFGGHPTSGSDREFDRGGQVEERRALETLGIEVLPQDGARVSGAGAVVTSTAVEAKIPDIEAARRLGIPVLHRAEVLGHLVNSRRSIAIAGTSGKSTVTAMVFEILARLGLDPGLVTGGDLEFLKAKGLRGNAFRGRGPLVVEADESDGSLVQHAPEIGCLLNLHRDHMEPAEALALFDTFRRRVRGRAVMSDDPAFARLRKDALVFGTSAEAEVRAEHVELATDEVRFTIRGAPVRVPMPGAHTVANAVAAIATAHAAGVPLADAARALADYAGVARRFQRIGVARGVTVIDDYAHNPTKVLAAIAAAQLVAPRVLAFFQPHGFAPTRFMRRELVELLRGGLRPDDRLWLGEIFYAGGTVTRDLSAAEIAQELQSQGRPCGFLPDRTLWRGILAEIARPGDLVLVMGGRDPSLSGFARSLLSSLGGSPL